MIDELKETGDKNNKVIHDRIDRLQVDLKTLSKFRWQVGGVLIVVAIVITAASTSVPHLLTRQPQQVIIERQ